jgi:hypothetical protein
MAKKPWHPTKRRGTNDAASVVDSTVELDAWSYLKEVVVDTLRFV